MSNLKMLTLYIYELPSLYWISVDYFRYSCLSGNQGRSTLIPLFIGFDLLQSGYIPLLMTLKSLLSFIKFEFVRVIKNPKRRK